MKPLYLNLTGLFALLFSISSLALAQAPVYNKKYGAKRMVKTWIRRLLIKPLRRLMRQHAIHPGQELFVVSVLYNLKVMWLAFNEEIRDYWSVRAGDKGEWLSVDLRSVSTVNAVQLNFAENNTQLFGREEVLAQQYLLEYSTDKKRWKKLVDKTANEADLTHQYQVFKKPLRTLYLKVTNYRVPGGTFAVSGFRVFGRGQAKNRERLPLLKW